MGDKRREGGGLRRGVRRRLFVVSLACGFSQAVGTFGSMNIPDEVPKLPTLPFILSDVALLGLATAIALRSADPFTGGALVAIVVCVVVGALVLAIPFVANYGRRMDATLNERQDQIAALAQTTATSAEQLSIAVAGLQSVAEAAAKSQKAVEALPHKLQEKVAEFRAQLNEIAVTENEALEQEVQTLRAAESDRLLGAIDQVAATARQLETVAEQARERLQQVERILENMTNAGTDLTRRTEGAVQQIASELDRRLTEWRDETARATALEAAFRLHLERLEAERSAPPAPPSPAATPVAAPATALGTDPTPSRDDAVEVAEETIQATSELEPVSGSGEVAPAVSDAPPANTEATPASAAVAPAPAVGVGSAPAKKRRATLPKEADLEQGMLLDLPPIEVEADADGASELPLAETALSADGATRLLVTAYIGIGNRLFVRGSGAGLSWEKGVPLQFVSIGKWRWETQDAVAPLSVRLYKNDQVECTTLGEVQLQPGHQHEVAAKFG